MVPIISPGFLSGGIAYPNRNPEYICGSRIDNFFKPYPFNRGSNFFLLLSVFSLALIKAVSITLVQFWTVATAAETENLLQNKQQNLICRAGTNELLLSETNLPFDRSMHP